MPVLKTEVLLRFLRNNPTRQNRLICLALSMWRSHIVSAKQSEAASHH